MWVVLCVCFIAAFVSIADGQTNPDAYCNGVEDFNPCLKFWECDLEVSKCFCKSGAPYCRCNNYIDEFYIGKSCSQKWTMLTFALVATLPGVALAFVIGVAVHLAHRFGKPSKSHGHELTSTPEEDLFPGVVFASDMNSPPRPPPGPAPLQVRLPMVSPRPYSVSDNTQFLPGGPSMGSFRPQYSAPDNTRPAFAGPQQRGPYSLPPSTLGFPDCNKPYSNTGGGAQVLSNPYAGSRNPYEESAEPYNQPPSHRAYDEQRMAPPPAPPYSAPDYRSALPRAQVGRLY